MSIRGELISSLLLLKSLDDEGKDARPAVKGFAQCNVFSLHLGDVDGFVWSVELLQAIVRRSARDDETSEDLFTSLLESFRWAEREQEQGADWESSVALAAFHVARRTFATTQRLDAAQGWYVRCLCECKTGHLRYRAAADLGSLLDLQGDKEEALRYFEAARAIATDFWQDSFAIVSFQAARILATLGRIPEAMEMLVAAQETLGTGVGVLLSALSLTVYVDMLRFQGSSVEDIVGAYSRCRVRLASLMPDLHKKLVGYCGAPCCSSEFLLKFLNMDQFSKYFVVEASTFDLPEVEPAIQVERSFFLFELYRTCRKAMIKLQLELPIAAYMDPRPHFEEGIDMLITRGAAALDQLVVGQQIAVRASHTSWLFLASVAIQLYIQIRGDVQEQLISCFENRVVDGEDPQAWALFYLGKSGMDTAHRMSQEHYEILKQALQRSRTSLLGFYATEVLGAYGAVPFISMATRLEYLERNKAYAYAIGKEELIMAALNGLFEVALMGSWMFEQTDNIRKELLETSKGFQYSRLGIAVALSMKGFVQLHLNFQHDQAQEWFSEVLAMVNALPIFPPLAYHHMCLAKNDDTWTIEHNNLAVLVSNNARIFVRSGQLGQLGFSFGIEEPSLRRHAYKRSLDEVQSLVLEGKLDEAETIAAELSRTLDNADDDFRGTIAAPLKLALAQIAAFRYQQTPKDLKYTLDSIRNLMEEAIDIADTAAELFPFKGFSRWVHCSHATILASLGETAAAIVELEKSLSEACLSLDPNFGSYSFARMVTLEGVRPLFHSLQSLIWELKDFPRSLIWEERERARDLLYSLKNKTDRTSHLKNLTEFDTDYEKAWSEIESIGLMLGKDTALIVVSHRVTKSTALLYTYFLHPDIEVVGHRHQHFTPVAELLQSIASGTSIATSELLAEYHNILLRPFEEELQRVQLKTIIFVPSGDMCKVPFSALIDESKPEKPYLIQRYATATVTSLRLLKQCVLRARDLSPSGQIQRGSSLVVGNPTSDLEQAEKEVAVVEGILKRTKFDQVTALLRGDATKQAVLDLLPRSSWIHFACHCIVDKDFPQGSLLLSSSSSSTTTSDTGDHVLGAEIQELEAPFHARGVVLSGCRSGLGSIAAEGILALPRSFHLMGVPSVVVSLWDVDDEDGNLLMGKMYANLLNGLQLAQALQGAMVDMIEAKDEDFFSAVYSVQSWASFTMSGSPFARLAF